MTVGSKRTVFQCAARGCEGCTVCEPEDKMMKDFTEQAEVEWCEECQNFFPVVDGVTECDCNIDFELPSDKELDFND